jgi:hypothetical protein
MPTVDALLYARITGSGLFTTSNLVVGLAVPTPTFPLESILNLSIVAPVLLVLKVKFEFEFILSICNVLGMPNITHKNTYYIRLLKIVHTKE